jgi:hypothetical protein
MPIKHAIWKVAKLPEPLREISLATEQPARFHGVCLLNVSPHARWGRGLSGKKLGRRRSMWAPKGSACYLRADASDKSTFWARLC